MSVSPTAAIRQIDTRHSFGVQADAPASVRPVTSLDAGSQPGWGCWLCGIHEDAPTVELARVRVMAHVAFVHGDLVDLARRNNDPSAVTPCLTPAPPRGTAPSRARKSPRRPGA